MPAGWMLILFSILSITACRKSDAPPDFTPPEITITSPESEVVYHSPAVILEYSIKEPHFKDAWYTLNNGNNVGLGKEGSDTLHLDTGEYKLILVARDDFLNTSRDSVTFYVNLDKVPGR